MYTTNTNSLSHTLRYTRNTQVQGTRTYSLSHTEKQHTRTTATYTHIGTHADRGAPVEAGSFKSKGSEKTVPMSVHDLSPRRQHASAYVSIRQHTSEYVSIRQHTSAYVSIHQHTSAYAITDPLDQGRVLCHSI
jgi:hypothetical protein